MLAWDRPNRIIGFRNTYRLYRGDVFHTGGATPFTLPHGSGKLPALDYTMDGQSLGLEDYLRRESVTGLLILKNGRIAYEYYGGGNTATTLWTSRSVGKSVVSVLVGIGAGSPCSSRTAACYPVANGSCRTTGWSSRLPGPRRPAR